MEVDIDGDTGPCDDFDDNEMYVELLSCPSTDEDVAEPSGCSYIINPAFNTSDGDYHEQDGAFPLSSELCYVRLDKNGVSSHMYWCNPDVNEAFVSYWKDAAGCSGFPNATERVWSTVGDFACTGDNGALCKFGFVTTSEVNSSNPDDCAMGPYIDQSARLLDTCWSSIEKEEDDDGTILAQTTLSWMVDCEYDTLTIQIFTGDDCDDENLANTIVVNNNECVSEFMPGDSSDKLTHFAIHWCSKTDSPTDPPTSMPTVSPTDMNTSDAKMIKVFISVLFSLFMYVVY